MPVYQKQDVLRASQVYALTFVFYAIVILLSPRFDDFGRQNDEASGMLCRICQA